MRTALPFLVPLLCLVGLAVAPSYAPELAFALAASILTIALAAPSLIEAASREAGADAKESAASPTSSPRAQAASISRSSSSVSRAVWLWRAGVGVEVLAILWTFVSLGALVVAPEAAEMWSLHLGVSMLTVMVWTPLIVFARPSDTTQRSTSSEAFIPEAEQQIHRPVQSRSAVAVGEGESSSPPTQAESTRTLWSYGETAGDASNEAGGDGSERPSPPSSQVVSPGRSRAFDGDRSRSDRSYSDRSYSDRSNTDREEDASTGWLDSGVFDTGSFDRDTDPYDTGAIWGRWPDEDDPSPVRDTPNDGVDEPDTSQPASPRSLWSFPEEDEGSGSASAPSPSHRSASPFDEEYDTGEQEMAWHVLESIIEEDEGSRSKDANDTWEPEEWPDFNYDV